MNYWGSGNSQTLYAEGGVGLEAKGGSKGSVVVLGCCFGNESFSDGCGLFMGCYLVLSLRGD